MSAYERCRGCGRVIDFEGVCSSRCADACGHTGRRTPTAIARGAALTAEDAERIAWIVWEAAGDVGHRAIKDALLAVADEARSVGGGA